MVEDYKPKKRLEMEKETIFYEESPMVKIPKAGSEIQVHSRVESSAQKSSNPLVTIKSCRKK